MSTPVVTVAAGGLPVVDVSATTKVGLPVSEAANGFGTAVTKVVGKPGMPVVYTTPGGGSSGTAGAVKFAIVAGDTAPVVSSALCLICAGALF